VAVYRRKRLRPTCVTTTATLLVKEGDRTSRAASPGRTQGVPPDDS